MDVTYDAGVRDDRREQITRLVTGFALPEHAAGCRVAVLAGGASNANYLLTGRDGARSVLRVASPGAGRFGIDRSQGLAAHRAVAAIGLAPELLASDDATGHSIARFLTGRVLAPAALRDLAVLERVATALRRIHDDAGPIAGRFSIFRDQADYTVLARREGLALPADIDELNAAADRSEALFASLGIADRLCHNDLQIPNLVDDGEVIRVLDWEFAGTGNPYLDLGSITVNGELDDDGRTAFLRAHFGEDDPRHHARVELMRFMSALREATWAVIAAPVLDLDWDYAAWAAEYYGRARRSLASGDLERALAAAV